MAQQRIQMDQEKLCCSICLDFLKDPVTIPCGHSYCMNCIKSYWNEEDQKEIHSCPQCRQIFTPRPALVKSTVLADLVEELKKTRLQAAPADHCYAGPGDVACDFCTGRKQKATKSCLQCLVSYCEQHLQPHYESPAFEKHKLVDPSKKLQENICSHHDEVMKIFCRTDQQCICYLCSMDEHKGHDTVSAAAERTERQRELGLSQQKLQQRIQDREKDVKVLQQEVEAISHSADEAVRDIDKMSTELVHLIEKRGSDIKQQIRSQQETEVSRVKELEEKLQQEITELRRRDTEMKQLAHTNDHIQFLHNYPSLSCLNESTDSPILSARPLQYFEEVTAAVSEAKDKLQDILKEEWNNISLAVRSVDVLKPQPEPKTRAEFLQYACKITLDPNTAHTQLLLSEGNRKATVMSEKQSYPQHPDRFTYSQQVMGRERLTGRCYWEVEWSGPKDSAAVTYKDISRTGSKSDFGINDRSWALKCYRDRYELRHDSISTSISGPQSSRVGVYLDHSAGILSFYSVSKTMTLIHRVQTTFTQPLYAGLSVYGYDKFVEFCELKGEMAQLRIQMDQERLCCSICLDFLKDPVTIPCGHSYCMNCIKSYWDEEDQKEIHSCPQCRQIFTPRPALVKSTVLADLVEELKRTRLQAAPADHCYAGPGDVACDVCTGRKLKATKSCLQCLVSYCEQHLQPHYESPAFEKHKLVDPSKKLQENICTRHNEVMKIFCRTDQQCICYLCSMYEHKDHDTALASAERTERQRELGTSRQIIQQRIQDREKDVKVLQQEVEAITCSADRAVRDSENMSSELVRLVEKRDSDVRQQIRSRQKTEVSRVKELEEKLQQEIIELRRRDADLEQLSNTEDHTQFLRNYSSLSNHSDVKDSSSVYIRPVQYFEVVTAAVSEARGNLQDILSDAWTNISLTVTEVDVLLPQPEPKSRDEFLKYACEITLDPNSAHTQLLLSEGNRKARLMGLTRLAMQIKAIYGLHLELPIFQVLSEESLTGRCYWEVELSGEVSVAVTYKNICCSEDERRFGTNDKSWVLECSHNRYHFRHNNVSTYILGPQSSRVGVYLDERAGIVSFYSISETMTLLHRVQTTFTQPLYAGLGLYYSSTAELCKLK
ncbi:uncharacterized protein ABDE67_017931 [Symphorus nematophorus]